MPTQYTLLKHLSSNLYSSSKVTYFTSHAGSLHYHLQLIKQYQKTLSKITGFGVFFCLFVFNSFLLLSLLIPVLKVFRPVQHQFRFPLGSKPLTPASPSRTWKGSEFILWIWQDSSPRAGRASSPTTPDLEPHAHTSWRAPLHRARPEGPRGKKGAGTGLTAPELTPPAAARPLTSRKESKPQPPWRDQLRPRPGPRDHAAAAALPTHPPDPRPRPAAHLPSGLPVPLPQRADEARHCRKASRRGEEGAVPGHVLAWPGRVGSLGSFLLIVLPWRQLPSCFCGHTPSTASSVPRYSPQWVFPWLFPCTQWVPTLHAFNFPAPSQGDVCLTLSAASRLIRSAVSWRWNGPTARRWS